MEEPENTELAKIILGRIRPRGRIPFAEFMDIALYHPREGYYQSLREKIGPRGDYYTSPHIHPIFGALLTRQLHQMWEILDHPSPFIIAEMGAGKGLLCADILLDCRRQWPDFYQNLIYVIGEISPGLQDRQKLLLSSFEAEGKVEWVLPDALLDGIRPFTGCLLSNELIDAFPVHLVQGREGRLWEIYVSFREGALQEVPGPLSTPLIEEYLRLYGSMPEEGQRAEVNLKALEWMEGVNRALRRGFVLTIDYGYEASELYHPERRDGTLLCYFRHTTSSEPYRRIGLQDITAHVNFTALIKKGEALGLKKVGYTEQYKFLVSLGLLQELESLEKTSDRSSGPAFWKNKLAMRNFVIPGGMGTLFKVLVQSKGVEESNLLGFGDPFRRA
ncbi:MAG TPA: SAM-dependent methyltransferase [Thermodesulfobacteriota bacterium]|nr:SAM-dependent methyltransferase [Thermodesulfobacteriota bacterium]